MKEKNKAIDINAMMRHAAGSMNSEMEAVLKNAIIANGIESIAFNNDSRISLQNSFSHEIKSGKITSQEKSGRCWMFAGLNLFRQKVSKKLNIDDFEFSQNYPMFFDKLEKANYFLESVIQTLHEDIYSRIVMWLLRDPLQDGGQWDMFVNIIKKYGAVPKTVMPETFHSSNSTMMNQLLTSKLRQWASELRDDHDKKSSVAFLREKKSIFLTEFYRLLTYFLGDPPGEFTFEYRDKDDKHFALKKLTPIAFFTEYAGIDPDEYISLIHSPTPDKPYGKMFTIDFLGNIIEGKPVLYLNAPVDELKRCTLSQLKEGEPVWFGCDIRMQTERKKGLMDDRVFLFNQSLNTDFSLDKTRRLLYGDSILTHAMVFTGMNLSGEKTNRWKVENSWGEERGEKGYFIMSDEWFNEYVYQVVVNKKFLSPGFKEKPEQAPIHLPPWDPMGSLAIQH